MGQLVTLLTVVMARSINALTMVQGGVLLMDVQTINVTWTLQGAQLYMGKVLQYNLFQGNASTSSSSKISAITASLPNIVGHFGDFRWATSNIAGPFYTTSGSGGTGTGDRATSVYRMYFDASRVSSIYENGATVRPISYPCKYFIKFY